MLRAFENFVHMPNRARRAKPWAAVGIVGLYACTASAQAPRFEFTGGITGILLSANDDRIGTDQTASADFNIVRNTRRGSWLVYIEANTTLDENAASTVIVESNADAGTALDPDRDGRVQISELNYRLDRTGERLTIGLIDPSSYLDRSRITNDENVQFLGVSFVNNPTIEFPDYTLGAAYERAARNRVPQINAVVTSSNGIADNPNLSYSQLIQVVEDNKGVFGALGVGWVNDAGLVRLGVWFNTRDHQEIGGTDTDASNYGLYTVLGRSFGNHGVSLRLGLANDDVTAGSKFAALAYRVRWRDHALGIGAARTYLSHKETDPTLDDSTQVELFGRFALTPAAHVTLSVQRIKHSDFHALPADPRSAVTLAGARFHYSF